MHHHGSLNLDQAFIELFAGAGGLSLGFINAGLKCLAAVEKDAAASHTYWKNLCLYKWSSLKVNADDKKTIDALSKINPETNNKFFDIPGDDWITAKGKFPALSLWAMDITKLDPREVMDWLGIKPKQLGFIAGGPPCQGFSYANSKRRLEDERNNMVVEYMKWVKYFRPKGFILENVRGILTLGKLPDQEVGPYPQYIMGMGKQLGYSVTYEIHNAVNYGVPQSRKRVIFVGLRKDVYKGKKFTAPEITHNYDYFTGPKNGVIPKEPFVTVYEAIGDLDWPLAALKESDSKKLPFGEKDRGPREVTKDNLLIRGNEFWVKDRFNGLFFKSGTRKPIRKEHTICVNCGKINLKVRKACWYCNDSISILNPKNSEYDTKIISTGLDVDL